MSISRVNHRLFYILCLCLGVELLFQPSAHALDKQAWVASHAVAAHSRSLTASSPASAGAISVSSQTYIMEVLNDVGKFTIGTVEGDPSRSTDNDKDLIYGHPNPSTSDTMVRIDGVSNSIHTGASSGVTADGDSLSVTLTVGEIQILERLTIKVSQATGRKDTVEIYFKVTNVGAGSHLVSLRTQIDTLLGSNDGAPFRIPNVGEVTKDLAFDNDPATAGIGDIPSQSLVLDSLTNPNIISLFTFRGLGFTTPDRVVFGYWPVSVDQWDYTVDPNRSFTNDSSVIVWWGYPDGNAFNMASGTSQEFAILYGIGNCNIQNLSPLTVLFCAPANIQGQALGASYQYAPINITAFLTDNSLADVTGATAALNFTPDFQLSPGFNRSRAVEGAAGSGVLSSSQTAQIDWQLTSNGRRMGERLIGMTVNINGAHSSTTRSLNTDTIANLLYGEATDENGNPISGAAVTILSGGQVVGSAITQSDGTYGIQGLSPGTYTVRLSVSGQPDTYTTGTVTDGSSNAVSGNPSAFSAGSALQAFAYPNPVREGQVHITYYTDSARAVDVQIFTTTGELICKITDNASGAGWHSVDWSIDDVANGVYFYQIKAGSDHTRGKIGVLKRRGL